jgi:hypothetical protein
MTPLIHFGVITFYKERLFISEMINRHSYKYLPRFAFEFFLFRHERITGFKFIAVSFLKIFSHFELSQNTKELKTLILTIPH